MPRIEGQVWIGTESPHRIKYFAGGTEYWAVSASTYAISGTVRKGMVVAIDNTSDETERVRPAVWPTDANNIAGICVSNPENGLIRVNGYGYLRFTQAELANAFVTASDLNVGAALTGANYYTDFGDTASDGGAGNGWGDTGSTYIGKGENIYWFTGRTLKTSSGYQWQDSNSFKGKLTFATPVGYKPNDTEVPWGDSSLDISYKNLPTIGNVVSYTYDGSGNLTELTMHVNFTRFTTKIQFEYPGTGMQEYTGSDIETLTLRHGLFSDLKVPEVDIRMMGYSDDVFETGIAQRVFPGYDTFLGIGVDKRTEVEIRSNSTFFYKTFGEVTFNF